MTPTEIERVAKGLTDAPHSWSGWPGAWCLNCGCDDPYETALAEGKIDFREDGETPFFPNPADEAAVCAKMVCPEPGSGRHNPYGRKEQSQC